MNDWSDQKSESQHFSDGGLNDSALRPSVLREQSLRNQVPGE